MRSLKSEDLKVLTIVVERITTAVKTHYPELSSEESKPLKKIYSSGMCESLKRVNEYISATKEYNKEAVQSIHNKFISDMLERAAEDPTLQSYDLLRFRKFIKGSFIDGLDVFASLENKEVQ